MKPPDPAKACPLCGARRINTIHGEKRCRACYHVWRPEPLAVPETTSPN